MRMTPPDVRAAIKAILVDVLELPVSPSAIGDAAILFDGELGLDSVAAIQILTEIEDHFDVRFEDEEIGAELFQSVNALAQSVEQHLGPRVDGRGR